MNATVCFDTDAALVASDIQSREDSYATAPLLAVNPLPQLPTEEELHTQFEDAISYRLIAIQGRLNSLSQPALRTRHTTHPLVCARKKQKVTFSRLIQLLSSWQRNAIVCCLALTLILVGFDLMGMLVLVTR